MLPSEEKEKERVIEVSTGDAAAGRGEQPGEHAAAGHRRIIGHNCILLRRSGGVDGATTRILGRGRVPVR